MATNTGIEWCDAATPATRSQADKWCTACKTRHALSEFGSDISRGDGLAAYCLASRRSGRPRGWHGRPAINPLHGRPGPAPNPPRAGDKKQARQRINVEVREGRRPHPNTLPCTDCSHVWAPGGRRHEYDHYLGYGREHHYDVQPVCTRCHAKRDGKASRTHCPRGHEFTPENTSITTRGGRTCLTCRREHDKKRGRDAAFWRAYREKRKAKARALLDGREWREFPT